MKSFTVQTLAGIIAVTLTNPHAPADFTIERADHLVTPIPVAPLGDDAEVWALNDRKYRTYSGGSQLPDVEVDAFDPTYSTFSRSSSAWEQSPTGDFQQFAVDNPAYIAGPDGAANGVAIRPSHENLLSYSDKFDEGGFWSLTNLSVSTSGTNIFGRDGFELTDDATSGFHRIRQTKTVAAGEHHGRVLVRPGTITQIEVGLGADFDSARIEFDLETLEWSIESGTAISAAGFFERPDGLIECWLQATSTGGTANFQIYLKDGGGISYTGTGKSLTIHQAQLSPGSYLGALILNDGTGGETRAGSQWSSPFTHSRGSFSFKFWSDGHVKDGAGRFWMLDQDNGYGVFVEGGNWTYRIINAGTTTDFTGTPVGRGISKIAFTADTASGNGTWAINGALMPAASGGPSGMATLYNGDDGSGTLQPNGAFVEVANYPDIVASDALLQSGTALDSSDIVVERDGTGGAYVYRVMDNSSDGLDFERWWLENVNADAPYTGPDASPNLGRGARGIASAGVDHVRRISTLEFGDALQQMWGYSLASFDSTKEVGVPEGNNFWAPVKGPSSEHGNSYEVSAVWTVDGQSMPPPLWPIIGSRAQLVSVAEWDSFINGAANIITRTMTLDWAATGTAINQDHLANVAVTVDHRSYPFMMGTKVDLAGGTDDLWEIAKTEESPAGVTATGAITDDIITNGNWIQLEGNGYSARMEVTSPMPAGARIWCDMAASTNRHKIYYDPETADFLMQVNDRREHSGLYKFGLV